MSFFRDYHKKIKWNFPSSYGFDNVQIGIEASNERLSKLGLTNIGDTCLPASNFGINCKRNAEGYSYADKTKEKELRVVNTISFYPYGNKNANEIFVDIERMCYPKVIVPPSGIELIFFETKDSKKYIIADLNASDRNASTLLRVINMFRELFGEYVLFDGDIIIDDSIVRKRCNWEILPPGEWPSKHLGNVLSKQKDVSKENQYFEFRLKTIESYKPVEVIQGKNGFSKYYAYLFKNICVLENGFYGNATYIIDADKWDKLSQLTKFQLITLNEVKAKLFHTSNWSNNIKDVFSKYETID